MKTLRNIAVFALLALLFSCGEELTYAPFEIIFDNETLGFREDESSKEIFLNLNRKSEEPITFDVEFSEHHVQLGKDYVLMHDSWDSIDVVNNTFQRVLAPKNRTVSFRVVKLHNQIPKEATLTFKVVGWKNDEDKDVVLTLHFDRIQLNAGIMRLSGRGDFEEIDFLNYVDFSSGDFVRVDRMSWTLGFCCGDTAGVMLNTGDCVTAAPTAHYKFEEVTYNYAKQFSETVADLGGASMTTQGIPLSIVDGMDGSVGHSIFGYVSQEENKNRVFFVAGDNNKGSFSSWFKVKVTDAGDHYDVKYQKIYNMLPYENRVRQYLEEWDGEPVEGDLSEDDYSYYDHATDVGHDDEENRKVIPVIKSLRITKDKDYNIVGLKLTHKNIDPATEVLFPEPKKDEWDIVWGYQTGFADADMQDNILDLRPYFMQDVILSNNLGGALTAELHKDEYDVYEDFNEAELTMNDIGFSYNRYTVGSKWRNVFRGINTNLYYVIKDPEGLYYKFRLLEFGVPAGVGERGHPVIEFERIK